MAGLAPILKALATVAKRERGSFRTMAMNNFFVFGALLLGPAGAFLFLIGGLVVLFPLSADPLRSVPQERLALWPLNKGERFRLRLLSPWINPLTWLLAALAIWAIRRTESRSLVALCTALVGVGFFFPNISGEPRFLSWIPAPRGPLFQLARKNLREMLLTLDVWVASILSFSGVAFCIFMPTLDPEFRPLLSLLVVLAVSSLAQCLFGLESRTGLLRYKLMPIPGWQVLAAKNAAFLAIVILLTAPLAPACGLAAGLATLVFGHGPSLQLREQKRWRFSSGSDFKNGLVQVFAMAGAGITAARTSLWILPVCALACIGTTWWFGRKLRQPF
ncbi:MAG TPA: hypothetical protein VNH18_21065 [Bryobacteraceae bacterium]|nr:hypothetical protein [Bryobacteraceae bacterium]